MVYNVADQLTSWPGMHRYSYNQDGSLLAVKNDGDTVTMASYTYTPEGLLETASFGASRTLANEWDADSNRVKLTVNGNEYEFVYDPTAGIPAVIEAAGEGSTTTAVRDFREPNGSLIARLDVSDWRYYHFDALGSTRVLTDDEGVVTDRYAYDAYGALLSHDRTADSIDQPYQYVGQLGYYTHCQEPDLGLLQLGVRFYDPEVGRFTSRDPLETDASDYAYADGNPLLRFDPIGMASLIACPSGYPGCWPCINKQAGLGWRDIGNWLKNHPEQELDGDEKHQVGNQANAVGHCVKACRAVRYCQDECGGANGPLRALQARECYSFWPWKEACEMDKYNNRQGSKCAAKPKSTSCVGCCIDLLNKKKLRWVKPKRNWPN